MVLGFGASMEGCQLFPSGGMKAIEGAASNGAPS